MSSRVQKLARLGQSVWIDWLSRELLVSGELRRLISDHGVSGVTTNPTILERAISAEGGYDRQIRELAALGRPPAAIVAGITAEDVKDAARQLRPTWLSSHGRDGYVSWEVDPAFAWNASATAAAVRELHERVAAPNLLVKIPATEPGLCALEDAIAEGLSVNVTLIFSPERYAATAESYLRGLRRAADAGIDLSRIHSVASVFISRLDTAANALLDADGSRRASVLHGRLGVATAKLAYRRFRACFSGERWEALRAAGARPQRLLWASTSTKDVGERDVRYVEELIGPGTVTTLPKATLEAFADHGEPVPGTLCRDTEGAAATFREFAAIGVNVALLADDLEQDGVRRFADSLFQATQRVAAVAQREAA